MAQRPPDPVSDPAQYQRFLLGLLADDDPADVQAATPTRIRALVAEAGDRLRTRPKPDEWSVLECIGHIVDGELVSSGRYRWILAHDEPPLVGYEQAFRLIAGHDRNHLAQARRALDAVC